MDGNCIAAFAGGFRVIGPIPFNRFFTQARCDDITANGDPEGKKLEELAGYLVLTLGPCTITNRVLGHGGEIDILARVSDEPNSVFSWMGRYLLLECKAQQDSVSQNDLGHFFAKMLLAKVNVGIIFSLKGLSGSASDRFAIRDRNSYYAQSNAAILDLTLDDVRALGSPDQWRSLLVSRYEEVRFGFKRTGT